MIFITPNIRIKRKLLNQKSSIKMILFKMIGLIIQHAFIDFYIKKKQQH